MGKNLRTSPVHVLMRGSRSRASRHRLGAQSHTRDVYTYIYMYASARLGGKSPPNANRHRYIRELRFERFQAVHMHNGLRAPLTYMHGSARIQHGRLAHTSSRHVGATYIEDGPPYMPTSESNVLARARSRIN